MGCRRLPGYSQDARPDEPRQKHTNRCSDEHVSQQVRPSLSVAAERKFRRAKDVIVAAEDRDSDSSYSDHLRREIQKRENRKKLFVAPEATCVDADRVVDDRDPDYDGHAQPPRHRVGSAATRQSKPSHPDHRDYYEKHSATCGVVGHRFAEENHQFSPFSKIILATRGFLVY